MDTGWIQVFVLTMSECIAPPGKTVCQQQEFQLEFATAEACELAREQFVALKSEMDNVIVNRDRTRCAASAREHTVYESLDEVTAAIRPETTWQAPPGRSETAEKAADFTEKAHKERLESLPTCDDSSGRRPCKIGEIILEESNEQQAEVWRREN